MSSRSTTSPGLSREGARPIFDRDEIKRPSRDDDLLDRPPVQQVARFVSSGPYLDAPRDSRNGQPPSRPIASHSRDTHSRDIHSRDIHSRDIPSHSRDIPSHSRDIPSRSRDVHEAPQHHSSSRAGPARDSYYEQEERREYRQRGFEEEEPRGRHDNGSHRSARRDDRDDLRHELELRRDPAARHSPERGARGRDVRGESDSDLRVRINEKRSTRSTDRVFRERADERGGRPHEHSSRPHERERRRSASGERRRDSYERKPPPGGGRSAGQQGAYRDRSPPPPAASSSRYHHEEREEYHEQPMLPWVPDPEHVPRGNAYFEVNRTFSVESQIAHRSLLPSEGVSPEEQLILAREMWVKATKYYRSTLRGMQGLVNDNQLEAYMNSDGIDVGCFHDETS